MNNFFLYNEALETIEFEEFRNGFEKLIPIMEDVEDYDHFLKHTSTYNLENYEKLMYDSSLSSAAIIKFIEEFVITNQYMSDEMIFDQNFPNMLNAYMGIDFNITNIPEGRRVYNVATFNTVRDKYLWELTPELLWQRREMLFPKLILCGDVEAQIKNIGQNKYFNQIIEKLKVFNKAINEWRVGNFNYNDIKNKYPLDISGESDSTMAKYGNQRRFSLPSGRKETFELHIKTGDLRFHFYPDNNAKKILIGYIGPHLQTVIYR